MYCPNCNSENSDSAKFCKKCGKPLQKTTINHRNMINEMNTESSSRDTTKIIIIALIVIAVVFAGAFIYIYGMSSNSSSDDSIEMPAADIPDTDDSVDASQPESSQSTSQSTPQTTSSMSILGGIFSTGSDLSDKTYASIYVGTEHAGESVKIQIYYSRDGSNLNNGNMVPKTVGSDGYIDVASAEAFSYYPDHATINLFDSNGNLLDSQSVNLNPDSGTQYF